MKSNYMVAAFFSVAFTLQLVADEVSTTLIADPTQRHLTELLTYFDEPRLMENIVVVGWLCTASFEKQDAYALEDDSYNLDAVIVDIFFGKGLFLTKEDCSAVEINKEEERYFNYSNGIELKITAEQIAQLRSLSGQLVTLRGDYFSWHNVISMESAYKSGVMQVKDMAAGNQRFQGVYGPDKKKE